MRHARLNSFLCSSAFLLLASAAAAQTPPPPPVTVAQATRTDVPVFATGVGTVQAYRSVLVRARVDGTLEKLPFREGQDVKPGDPLAEIDPRPYEAALQQARAKRDADAAQLQNAKLDLARYNSLARTNFASRQQVDTQQATVNQANANLEGDDAAIDAAVAHHDDIVPRKQSVDGKVDDVGSAGSPLEGEDWLARIGACGANSDQGKFDEPATRTAPVLRNNQLTAVGEIVLAVFLGVEGARLQP